MDLQAGVLKVVNRVMKTAERIQLEDKLVVQFFL